MADLTPVPDSVTRFVPAPSAATTVKKAVFDPVLVGLNFTEIRQVLPGGSVGGQLWLWRTDLDSNQLRAMELIESVDPPMLLRVTTSAPESRFRA